MSDNHNDNKKEEATTESNVNPIVAPTPIPAATAAAASLNDNKNETSMDTSTDNDTTNKRPPADPPAEKLPPPKRPRPEESPLATAPPVTAAAAAPSSPPKAALSPPKSPAAEIPVLLNPAVSCELTNDPVNTICGREYHDSALIKTNNGSTYTLKKGDSVFMKIDGEMLICRISGFFVKISEESQKIMVEGRWCLSRRDLKDKLGESITPDVVEFFNHLSYNEVVLTHLMEENEICYIQKQCDICYVKPDEELPTGLHPHARLCRYKLDIDVQAKTIEWQEYEGDDEAGEEKGKEESSMVEANEDMLTNEDDAMNTDTRTVETLSSASEDEGGNEESDSSSSSEAPVKAQPIQEGEGSALRGDIQVGPKYQMKVGKFVPGQTVRSRGAKLVFKKGAIDDDSLHGFLEKAAKLHRAYLKKHGILLQDPYTPLSQEEAENLMKELPKDELPTGSTLSTASMLSGKRCNLTKECSPDYLLEILSENLYDTKKALRAVEADLERITVGWTKHERDIFDDGFRRHEGELRPIARAIAPTKSMREVVDYHYRFKIPDQFRKYQDKKREQAARMLNCIETRQYHDSLVSSNDTMSKSSHWTEKSAADLATQKNERVQSAKDLLLEIKNRLGKAVMVNVASVVRELQVSYTQEARDDLFKLLHDQPELQKRFLGFLPKHV